MIIISVAIRDNTFQCKYFTIKCGHWIVIFCLQQKRFQANDP